MKKMSMGIGAIGLVLIAGTYWWSTRPSGRSEGESGAATVQVVDVEEVVENPERFTGPLAVGGRIMRVHENNLAFTLGCEDACVEMPVKFDGQIPKEGTDVVAYGEIGRTEQMKYIFIAREIKPR